MIGPDAIAVQIEPALFRLPSEAAARIGAALPQEVLIDLPARAPDAVPSPNRAAGLRACGRRLAMPARARLDRLSLPTLSP
nr:hypothetical protein GCM10020063_039130 [Dactylosporangium thailandense]